MKCQCNIASIAHAANHCGNTASEFRLRKGVKLALCSSCTLTEDKHLADLLDDETRQEQIELSKGV